MHSAIVCYGCLLTEIAVDYHQFCDQSVEYWDVPRLGGVASYLYKTHESQSLTHISWCLYSLCSFLLYFIGNTKEELRVHIFTTL